MIQTWRGWVKSRLSRSTLIGCFSSVFLLFTYFRHLGSLPAAMNRAEINTLNNSDSFKSLLHHPVNFTHHFFDFLLIHFHKVSTFNARAISAVFALILIFSFYTILKAWFGSFISWIGTLFFAFTPMVILAGRNGSSAIMALFPLTMVAYYLWIIRAKKPSFLRILFLPVLAALTLYMPGGLIVLLLTTVSSHKNLVGLFNYLGRLKAGICIFVFLLFITPLIYGAVQTPSILKDLTWLPSELPKFVNLLKDIGWNFLALFYKSSSNNDLQIGRIALLNIAQIAFALAGIYAMWTRARSKVYSILTLILIGVVFSALYGNLNVILLAIPGISIFVAAGLRYMHIEWTTVFPRNPIPRGLAFILIFSLAFLHVAWGVRYSVYAWPHTAPVKKAYVLKYQ